MLSEEIKNIFINPPDGKKIVIITVGNDLRNDDGVGVYIAGKLKKINNDKILLINAGMKPENIIDEVIDLNPAKVVFIDAANFNDKPGEIKLIDKENISGYTLSTHVFPLNAIAKIIEDDTGAKVFFVCIQIKDASLGETINKEVIVSADVLIKFLSEI